MTERVPIVRDIQRIAEVLEQRLDLSVYLITDDRVERVLVAGRPLSDPESNGTPR